MRNTDLTVLSFAVSGFFITLNDKLFLQNKH